MIAGWKGLGIGVKTACAAALGLKSEAATRITALRSDKKLRMEGATEGISLPGEGIACPECEAQKAWVWRRFVPQAAADDIAARASVETVDPDAIADDIRTTRHPLVPALHALQHESDGAAWAVEWKALPGICMGVGLAPRIVDRVLERLRSSGRPER